MAAQSPKKDNCLHKDEETCLTHVHVFGEEDLEQDKIFCLTYVCQKSLLRSNSHGQATIWRSYRLSPRLETHKTQCLRESCALAFWVRGARKGVVIAVFDGNALALGFEERFDRHECEN